MNTDAWMDLVKQRLAGDGFTISAGSDHGMPDVPWIAHREKYEALKGVEAVSVFLHELQPGDVASVQAFSTRCYERAVALKKFPLPNGFFAATTAFPVAYSTRSLPPAMQDFLEGYTPKHFAKFEFPVLVDLELSQVHFKQGTPTWGAIHYAGFRDFAQRAFAPNG